MKIYHSFKDFLEKNEIDFKAFLENCKPWNQQWISADNLYQNFLSDIYLKDKRNAIHSAFNHEENTMNINPFILGALSVEWNEVVDMFPDIPFE